MVDLSFPRLRDNWSLDVVNILAVLGEHNIEATSQLICLSRFCFLPRLIPAPQGLLARRPVTLDSEDNVDVIGIYNGNSRKTLNYFAKCLHGDGSWLSSYTVRILNIKPTTTGPNEDLIRPRRFSPLNIIAMISCAISLALMIWAIVIGDGVGLTGILIMSFTTPLLCIGMKWTPNLPSTARKIEHLPAGDIVFRTPGGSITVVRCNEAVARALYFHPDRPEYLVSSYSGRGISGIIGGSTLVGSIVLFGNAHWTTKAALVVTYTLLNLLYWLAAILPPRWSWHMSFSVHEEDLNHNENYTTAIWSAIRATRQVTWAREGGFVPATHAWDVWLEEALNASRNGDEWDPQRAFVRAINGD